MDKKIIETIFDKILSNIKIKCFYEYAYVQETFEKCAEKYNLKLIKSNDKKVAYSLLDEKHQVTLNFTKRFINTKILGFREDDNKLFNLDDVFQVYDNFPNNIKHTLNLITYDEGDDDNKNLGIYGESDFLKIRFGDVSGIILPHYLFENKDGEVMNFLKNMHKTGKILMKNYCLIWKNMRRIILKWSLMNGSN